MSGGSNNSSQELYHKAPSAGGEFSSSSTSTSATIDAMDRGLHKLTKSKSSLHIKKPHGTMRPVSSDADIMSAVLKSDAEPDLIGDFTMAHGLPLTPGKHQDLKSISPETLASLMNGDYNHIFQEYTIVDCRYPYEFNGGHISGAVNLYTQNAITERFFNENTISNHHTTPHHNRFGSSAVPLSPVMKSNNNNLFNISREMLMMSGTPEKMNMSIDAFNTTVPMESPSVMNSPSVGQLESELCDAMVIPKRTALIFHCEFSSKRAPKLYRFLRSKDREQNQSLYPRLNYPEIYILDGGYKAFYEKFRDLCEPKEYMEMSDDRYSDQLKHFKAKCKNISRNNQERPAAARSTHGFSLRSSMSPYSYELMSSHASSTNGSCIVSNEQRTPGSGERRFISSSQPTPASSTTLASDLMTPGSSQRPKKKQAVSRRIAEY